MKYNVARASFDKVQYENIDRISKISGSIRNVQHPKVYGKWAFNIRLTPSFHWDNLEFQTGATHLREGRIQTIPNIEIKRISGMGNLKLTLHTPIGSFAASGGFGSAFYNQTNNYDVDTYQLTEIRKINLSWLAFFSKRFFVLAGPRYYKERYEQFSFAFRFGYFWGDYRP